MQSNFDKIYPILTDSLSEALHVTLLVLLVMTVVEVINISSLGRKFEKLKGKPGLQILLSSIMGAIPGCAGGFIVVSLFLQNIIVFPALVAGMIATFGDEAIFMYVTNPKMALATSAILVPTGVITGLVISKLHNRNLGSFPEMSLEKPVHYHKSIPAEANFKEKAVLFLKDHVWGHIIKEHALKVFLYVLAALLVVGVADAFWDLKGTLTQNATAQWIMLVAAVIVGFLPVSGPHLVFVVMFLQGYVPFGVLIANSITQNGHAGMPLLASSSKNFLKVKIVSMLLGFVIGTALLLVLRI